jgi:lysophospholipase L1-like esterase
MNRVDHCPLSPAHPPGVGAGRPVPRSLGRVRREAWQNVGLAALTAAVLAGAVYLFATWPPEPPTATSAPAPSPGNQRQEQPVQTISTLSDSHLVHEESWFVRTVQAGRLAGYTAGTLASQPGADAETVRQLADQVDGSDWVVVQAGTNDLLAGDDPGLAFADVQSLVRSVRRPNVILALVPPSNERPDAVVRLNRLLTRWAERRDIPVLDVYSPVATKDGRFLPGTTDDDVHVNDRGAQLQAQAAMHQLRRILP